MKIKLGFFYDAWKAIADWIKGESSDKPKVEVDGTVEVSNLPQTQQVAGEIEVTNLPEVQKVEADQPLPVSLYGTIEGLLADRPNPGTVPIGTRYWAVDTGEYAVSTGTTWRVLGVV